MALHGADSRPAAALQVGGVSHSLWTQGLNNTSKVSRPSRVVVLFAFCQSPCSFLSHGSVVAVERAAPEPRETLLLWVTSAVGQKPRSGNSTAAGASLRGAVTSFLGSPRPSRPRGGDLDEEAVENGAWEAMPAI